MFTNFEALYRALGVKRSSDLSSPKITPLEDIVLPKRSAVHYLKLEEGFITPPNKHQGIFAANDKIPHYVHVKKSLGVVTGSAIKHSSGYSAHIKEIKALSDVIVFKKPLTESVSDTSLLVIDYSSLNRIYTYKDTTSINKFKRLNDLLTELVSTINLLTDSVDPKSVRHNYITFEVPEVDLQHSLYLSLVKKGDKEVSKIILNESEWLVFTLLKWMSDKPTVLSKLTENAIKNSTFILRYRNQAALLSLDYLHLLSHKLKLTKTQKKIGIAEETLTANILMQKIPWLFASIRSSVDSDYLPEDMSEIPDHVDDDNKLGLMSKEVIRSKDAKIDPVAVEESVSEVTKALVTASVQVEPLTPEEQLQEIVVRNKLSTTVYKNRLADLKVNNTIKNPLFPNEKLVDVANSVTLEDMSISDGLQAVDNSTIIDKSVLNLSLDTFDKKYIKRILPRHISKVVQSLNNNGINIGAYEINQTEDITGTYVQHSIKVKPIEGRMSVLPVKLPGIEADGTFLANGTKYYLKKQRCDRPIKKTKDDEVVLSSYYPNKVFVRRYAIQAQNRQSALVRGIMKKADKGELKVTLLNTFDKDNVTPIDYSYLAMRFKTIVMGSVSINLSYKSRSSLLPKGTTLKSVEKKGVVIGTLGKNVLTMDESGTIHEHADKKITALGMIEDVLSLSNKIPSSVTVIKILGRTVYVGLVMSYLLGMTGFLKHIKAEVTVLPSSEVPKKVDPSKVRLKFKDVTVIISNTTMEQRFYLTGFDKYTKVLAKYNYELFDAEDVYLNLLGYDKLPVKNRLMVKHLKELKLLNNMFVDPITKETLDLLKEPTTFIGLLTRSNELLLNAQYKESSADQMIRGYERIPGMMYSELVKSVRDYSLRRNPKRQSLELSPYAVWNAILSDQTKEIVKDINPIHDLKQKEVTVQVGFGGRNKETVTEGVRKFDKSHLGVFNGDTVDDGNAGSTVFLSPSANLNNIHGLSTGIDNVLDNPAASKSTSFMLAPGLEHDDGKRQNFAGIHNSHFLAIKGGELSYTRTDYDKVVQHRTSDLYAATADMDGEVIKSSKRGISIRYKDDTIRHVALGKKFGKADAALYPFNIVTSLKKGDMIKKGTPIAYNEAFFTPDTLDGKGVVMKQSVLVPVGLVIGRREDEDSCTIAKSLVDDLLVDKSIAKTFLIDFDQNVHEVVKIGSKVSVDSVMSVIEGSATSINNIFTDESIATLKTVQGKTRTAGIIGVVERIEVRYHGELEDMSLSLKGLASTFNKQLKRERKAIGKKPITGEVGLNYSIKGKPLPYNSAEVKIIVSYKDSCGVGDKLNVSHQMKTTISSVTDEDMIAEDGTKIQLTFGFKSVSARIVNSVYLIGIMNALLKFLPNKLNDIYHGESK